MKIAIAQINPVVGNLEENSRKIASFCLRAQKQGVEIVVFPELSLCGYPPEDLVFKPDFLKKNQYFLKRLKEKIGNILAVVGFVDFKGHRIYNAAALISQGEILHIYRKIILPNYGVFDEKRYFSAGWQLPLYQTNNKFLSLTICEDIWQGDKLLQAAYQKRPFDFIVNISASPFNLGKIKERAQILKERAKNFRAFVIYCNLVGAQDELVFDGSSMVFGPNGRLLALGKRFSEDFLVFNSESWPQKRVSFSYHKVEDVYKALVLGIKDYVKKNGFKKAVVGVSGGIDSAVVLALAVAALGKNNVEALVMPSRYTSKATLKDASKVCQNLGVRHYLVGIEEIVSVFKQKVAAFAQPSLRSLAAQNLQARVRGAILMAFSNQKGALVLNTGNKSELSVGYCTLYGDMVGGFGVLKDVYKTMVYQLAKFINRQKKLIPLSIIKRPPSAELKPEQKDEDDLPPYNLLDEVLKMYIEEEMPLRQIVKQGFSSSLVKKIIRMVDRNEYKRRQAPPGVKITTRAFGKERRMPIINQFNYR